jgi:beta-N-acetylhexosaminidase
MIAHAPLIIDIAGTALDANDRRRLTHPLVGGAIFFTRNWQNRQQITEVVAEMKSIRPDLLVTVDHEGGRVQRFRADGFTHLPPMAALGERWMNDGEGGKGSGAMAAQDAATACGYVLGAELRACGIDMSFTPVLDLDHGRSAIIGNRALHRDPRVAATLAKSVIHGLLRAGMANCGKHFPGHGYVELDSHVALPIDTRPLAKLLADDARPYEWLSTTLTAVMPAHVIYAQVDHVPAGFSERWLKEILRGRLDFQGAIVSDDLSMAGARVIDGRPVTYTEAAVLALNAGCDLLLLCNQSLNGGAPVDELIDGLARAQQEGLWHADPDSEVRRLALIPQSPPRPWDELMHDAVYQHALERLP